MASSLSPVRQALDTFLAGGLFMPFWSVVMDATAFVDDDAALSDIDRDWFDELYDLVCMSGEDPLDAASRNHGIRGAESLRQQIRELRLEKPDERRPHQR